MSGIEAPITSPTLRASFSSSEAMQSAVEALGMSGFDHAEIALVEPVSSTDPSPPEAEMSPVYDEADARQARTLHASGAATAAGLAAAGIIVATGGLAAVAVGAAIVAGAAAGGLSHAVDTAGIQAEQLERDTRAADGRLVLSVQVPTAEKKARAEAILREAGAEDITTV